MADVISENAENSEKIAIIDETIPIIPKIGQTIPKNGETIPKIGETIPKIGETIPKNGSSAASSGETIPKNEIDASVEHEPKKRGRPSGAKDRVVRVKKPRVILEERVVPPNVEPEPVMPTQPVFIPSRPRSISPETRLRNAHNIVMDHRRSHYQAKRSHWDGQILKSLRLI